MAKHANEGYFTMLRPLRIALAAAVGVAALALPATAAQAAGYTAPTLNADSVTVYPAVPPAGVSGSYYISYDNPNDVALAFDKSSVQSVCPYPMYFVSYDYGLSNYSSQVPAHGLLLLECPGLSAGNYTVTAKWTVVGTGETLTSASQDITVPTAAATTASLGALTPDHGFQDGTAAVSVCADPTYFDSGVTVVLDSTLSQSLDWLTGCATVKFSGLAAGTHSFNMSSSHSVYSDTPVTFTIASQPAPTPVPVPQTPSVTVDNTVHAVNAVVAPTISGKPAVAGTLSASGASFVPASAAVSYQWLRSGVAIPGATAATYKPVAADFGKQISVQVTGSLAGYSAASSTSSSVTIGVGPALVKTKAPAISGKAKVGKKLTATAGSWTPKATKVSYQWLRNGKAIKGATKAFYIVTKADKGKKLSVKVTAQAIGYAKGVATSKATAAVK